MLSEQQESQLYRRLRTTLLKTTIRELVSNARLRVAIAAIMSVVLWIALFLIMHEGFTFLHKAAGAFAQDTIEKVFNIFYASLMVMLFFSSAIILYGSLYRSSEVAFLITTPTRPTRIFTYKFHEAIFFSSWGFLLLGSPMLLAYGIVAQAPWYYYVLLLPFMFAFIYIPAGIGAIACLLVVHQLSRFRRPLIVTATASSVLAAIWVSWTVLFEQQSDMLTPEWFEETMMRLSATEIRFSPSWWLCSGLLEAVRNDGQSLDYQPWAQAILFLALLVSNALFFHLLAVFLSGRLYLPSFSRLQTERSRRRMAAVGRLDRLLAQLLILTPPAIRLLLIKDFRVFRRDPTQWAQFLIFFGLVGLYFLNIKSVDYATPFAGWVNVVSFLNLTVVGLILSTFTTRFIFPMISLEGRRFWILGLLPVPRETILWGKFLFAAIGTFIPSSLLILISDVLLQIPLEIILIHEFTCVLLCAGLSAIAVGLGARMPDLRETNPSKIAAGFGGTLNLVLSAMYIVAVVGLTAVPCHLHTLATLGQLSISLDLPSIRSLVITGIMAALVLGAATTWVPLLIGFRAFRRMEF